jgi:hypothetical protein
VAELAAMAGIARENVTRILNDWQRRKLVSRLSGYYCLENKAYSSINLSIDSSATRARSKGQATSEPHNLSTARAKRRPWWVFIRVFIAHGARADQNIE